MKRDTLPKLAAVLPYVDTSAILIRCSTGIQKQEWRKNLARLNLLAPGWNLKRSQANSFLRLNIPGPTTERVLTFLFRVAPDAIISRVDIAMDIIPHDPDDCEAVARWVNPRLVQRWSRAGRVSYCKGTRYSTPSWAPTTLVTYIGKSKAVPSRRCLRLEVRFKGARRCKSMGFFNLHQLRSLDLENWWRKNLIFEEIDLEKLGRHVTGRSRAKSPDIKTYGNLTYNKDLRAGQLIAINAAYAGPWLDDSNGGDFLEPSPSVGAIRHHAKRKGYDITRSVTRIPCPYDMLLFAIST